MNNSSGKTLKQYFEQRAKRQDISITNTTTTKKPELFKRLQSKPFWIWSQEEHKREYIKTKGQCCYMHIVGLFEKHGEKKPLFPFQQILIDTIEQHKYLVYKKPVGIGATSLFLAWCSYKCLVNDDLKGKEIAIVVGPNQFLGSGLISRVKQAFIPHGIILEGTATSAILSGATFNAYPSNHLDALRSREPKIILVDELSYFPPGQQLILRDCVERYLSKSDPYIIMCSTVASPHDLLNQIFNEPDDKCLYKKVAMDWRTGAGTIYSEEDIRKARASPSFSREMECVATGLAGDVFSHYSIEKAIELGQEVDTENIDTRNVKYIGCDPGFSSSNTAITVAQLSMGGKNRIEVIYSKEIENAHFSQVIDELFSINHNFGNVEKIFVDGSAVPIIRELKLYFGERQDWTEERAEFHQRGFTDDDIIRSGWLKVIDVNFQKETRNMLWSTKRFLESGHLAIPAKFERLLISMRTARAYDGKLDKAATEYDDSLESLNLALNGFSFRTRQQRQYYYGEPQLQQQEQRYE